MRIVMSSFQAPRWLAPLLFLVALALIPFALFIGLVLLGLVLGAAVVRLLLPASAPPPAVEKRKDVVSFGAGSKVIDADYEIKDGHEKGND